MKKKSDEWDTITATVDGRVIWKKLGRNHSIVVANRGENPDDALKRSAKARPKSKQRSRRP